MLTIPSNAQNSIASPQVVICLLISIEFASGTVYLTDAPINLIYGGNTYIGAGEIINIEFPEEENSLSANGLSLTFTGCDAAIVAIAMTEHVQGRSISVRLAAFDYASRQIIDAYTEWTGRVDQMICQESGDSASILLTAENRLADWSRPRLRRYTDADQQAEYPGDKGFEYVAQMVDQEIVWPDRTWRAS